MAGTDLTTVPGFADGIRLQARVLVADADGSHPRQLRLLGDERRGYLLAGTLALPGGADAEFWFATVNEAFAAGEGFGVSRADWSRIERLDEVL